MPYFSSYLWGKYLSTKIFTVLHQSKKELSDFDQNWAKTRHLLLKILELTISIAWPTVHCQHFPAFVVSRLAQRETRFGVAPILPTRRNYASNAQETTPAIDRRSNAMRCCCNCVWSEQRKLRLGTSSHCTSTSCLSSTDGVVHKSPNMAPLFILGTEEGGNLSLWATTNAIAVSPQYMLLAVLPMPVTVERRSD